ncbi:MAG: DUF3343 domain-containing protein [Eubacteriales bacterium]|nr:DUF3343 domain-containing protein [Eubacteriales bacterium]
MENIATFHTHLGALRFQRKLEKLGKEAALAPVPRKLSASCGTCVRFAAAFDSKWADEDMEAVYSSENGEYALVFENEE